MGILDMVQSMAGGSDTAKVAGGLVQELEQRPGGIGGLMQSLNQNGMGGAVQQWAGGQTQPANPSEIASGLGSTGIIDSIAQRTGLSPTAVSAGLAAAMPILVHHMTSNGHVTPDGTATGAPAPAAGSILQSILSRLG